MFKTAGAIVAIFGTIFGGAYVLDKLAKAKEKMIEMQENDEVELDVNNVTDMTNMFHHDFKDCGYRRENDTWECSCGEDCKNHKCCGGCENCKCNKDN